MSNCTRVHTPEDGPELVCVNDEPLPHMHRTADGTRFIGAQIGTNTMLIYRPESRQR